MREYLKPYDDGRGDTARLQIFDTCRHLIESLPALQHDERNPEDAAGEPHEYTHAPEAVRYGIMSRPPLTVYTPPLTGKYTPTEIEDMEQKPMQIVKRR